MKRYLSLTSEHLTELTSSELGAVAGGGDTRTVVCLTGVYPTINYDCTRLVEDLPIGYSVDIC